MATLNDQLKTVLAIWVFLLVVLATLAQEAPATRDPDVDLDTVQTARRNGYPAESHIVQTADGYLLAVHRIPGELHSKTSSPSKPPPSPGAAAAPGVAAAGAAAAALQKPTAAASSRAAPWAPWSRTTSTPAPATTTPWPPRSRTTTTLLAEAMRQRPTRAGDARTRTAEASTAAEDTPRLLHTQVSTAAAALAAAEAAAAAAAAWESPRSLSRTTTTLATTCRICTPAPLRRTPTTTAWPSTTPAAEAAAEAGAGAAGAAVEAAEAAARWSASAPTTTRTETAAKTETWNRSATESATESERGTESEKERETERGTERAADATSSSTATTPTTALHPLPTSTPDSTDVSSPRTIATGMDLYARRWGPHTLLIRRRRSAVPAASSWPRATPTTTTAPSWTATRPHATTATSTTTSGAGASATATPARATTRTWTTRWTTPTSRTPSPSPPSPPRTPSSTPSPSPRTPSSPWPPRPRPRTPCSPRNAASTATDASSESPTDIPIGHRTQDTSTSTEDTTPTATSPITITTNSEEATTTSSRKPVVFLQHGLMGSSYDWILAGPENGLAYLLADAGFDVWMGNARGNTYSRAHVYLPTKPSSPYWDFSFHEMAVYDLPAVFEHILNVTGVPSLHYVGHSMGTTMFFALASLKPEVARASVASMHALAPVAFVQHIKGPLRLLAPQVKRVQFLVHWLGLGEFLPQNFIIKWLTKWGCEKLKIEEEICENFLFVLCGFDKQQFNDSILPALLSHTPAGASTQTILHFAQMILSGQFRQFDYGILDNRRKYGSDEPPPYDLSRVDVPVDLMYADNDWLASVEDVKTLYKSLQCEKQMYKVPLKSFNHLDFILAKDVKRLVNDRVLEDLPRQHGFTEENEFTENSVSNY